MRKIKIRLPATITNLGPGINSLGLALSLYVSVEISERTDETVIVETDGEGAGRYSTGLRHPVTLAMMRMFQKVERAPLGFRVKIENRIPLDSGLGAEAAFTVAGIIGANNLLGGLYSREEMLQIGAQFSTNPNGTHQADSILTSVLGGLTASAIQDDKVIYRSLRLPSFKVIILLPELENFSTNILIPERVALREVLHNLSRLPLLVAALQEGDLHLLAQVLDDKLRAPLLIPAIPGYHHVVEAGLKAGAAAITPSGNGPALLAFAEDKHEKVAKAMEEAFLNEGVKSRAWVLPVDTQGIVISAVQSS